jgi:branched-chain amino acid transport system substrate-binding protein
MRRRLLARASACLALAAAVGGCAAPSGGTLTAAGRTLTIYVSVPPGGGQTAQDVLGAERLAFQQAGGKVGTYGLRMVVLAGGKISDHARTAIQDSTAIAYLGEVVPGASAGSIGITNDRDLLQVSPTDTAAELTQTTPAIPNAPTIYYEALKTYGRTFARVTPNSSLEAKALVAEMQARGVTSVFIAGDSSPYGRTLARAVSGDAAKASIRVQPSETGAGAVLYAGSSETGAAQLFNRVAAANPSLRLFGPSALDDSTFASALSPATARQVEISSPGFLTQQLPPAAATQFAGPFKAAYGHTPATEAIFGYEAMSAVLAVLRQAGASANNRSTVVHGFFALKNRQSVLGTYSIDQAGDTNLGSFVISRISSGRAVPFKALQEQG